MGRAATEIGCLGDPSFFFGVHQGSLESNSEEKSKEYKRRCLMKGECEGKSFALRIPDP